MKLGVCVPAFLGKLVVRLCHIALTANFDATMDPRYNTASLNVIRKINGKLFTLRIGDMNARNLFA